MTRRTGKPVAKPAAPPRGGLVTAVSAAVGALLSLQALFFLYYSWTMATFPYQLDYGEGPILQIALRVAHGQPLYPNLTGYPYVIASYMPFYYLLCALGARIAGPSFLPGRLISLASALAIAVLAGLIVWDRTRQRFASFLAGGLVLAIPQFLVWSTLMRVDMLALALGVTGFYLFQRERPAAGVAAFALAVFTRRTTVAGAVGALADLAMRRGWGVAIKTALAQFGAIVVLVAGALLVTRGGLYRQLSWHTRTSLGASWTWHQVWTVLGVALREWPVYFLLAALGAVWCLVRAPHRGLFVYFLAACAVASTMGRIGSSHNYLLEPLAVGAMMTGVLWGEAARRPALARPTALLVGGAIALQLVRTGLNMPYSISLLRPLTPPAAARAVEAAIARAPGPVLAEDVGLIERAGKEAPLEPFEFTQLARAGIIDPTPVVDDIRRGRFSLIVLRFDVDELNITRPGVDRVSDRWLDEMLVAIKQRYRLAERASVYWVYVPRSAASP